MGATSPAGNWKAKLTDHIRATGGRITRPRMRVAEVFFSMAGHPGVEELAAEVHKRHKHIGYATVYRTMRLLVKPASFSMPFRSSTTDAPATQPV